MSPDEIPHTIFALSSGAGKSGIAVFRLSGSAAGPVLDRLTGLSVPTPRQAIRVRVVDPASNDLIDDGLVIWFPGPASFTGEDVVEWYLHGSPAVIAGMTALLANQPGVRSAEPGEFTRRAFDNGKLDLTQAEGLAELVDAETTAQRRQAHRQMAGELAELYDGWRDRLIHTNALFEAEIDFSDEDLPPGLKDQVNQSVETLIGEIDVHLDDHQRGQAIRDGVHIAIIGPPNAGKSSLLNWLARRDVAIVSETAGTTRDVIEVHLDLAGFAVVLADTAGLRDSGDDIETEGVRRARNRAADADIRLVVLDGATWPEVDETTRQLIHPDTDIVVVNKSDLGIEMDKRPSDLDGCSAISVKTGDGLDTLLSAIGDVVSATFGATSSPVLSRVRHRDALQSCRACLQRFEQATETELAAEDLRLAVRALGRITGRIDVEDVLDVIFKEFCIGK